MKGIPGKPSESALKPKGEYTGVEGKMKIGKNSHCDMPVSLLAESGDCFDTALRFDEDAINSFDEFLKRSSNTDSANLKNSLIENYIEGTMELHFYLFSKGGDQRGDYCFRPEFADVDKRNRQGKRIVAGDGRAFMNSLSGGQQLMFVTYVEFLKYPETIQFWIRSLIGLQTVDKCEGVVGKTFQPPFPRFEGVGSLANDEHCVSVGSVGTRQSPSHVIEGTSEIVDAIADDQSPLCLRQRSLCRELYQVASAFRVIVKGSLVGIAFQESVYPRIKRLQVFFPALKLPPALE